MSENKANKEKLSQAAFTCSKLTVETVEQGVKYVQSWRHWRRSGVFTVNFEHISRFTLVFLLTSITGSCGI